MISLSNTASQTIAPGEAAVLNEVLLHTGCGECYRKSTNTVKMKFSGVYELNFSGNALGTAGDTLSIAIGGVAIPASAMVVNTTARAISKTIPVSNCCGDFDNVTVINTGTNPITLNANPVLYIKRLS